MGSTRAAASTSCARRRSCRRHCEHGALGIRGLGGFITRLWGNDHASDGSFGRHFRRFRPGSGWGRHSWNPGQRHASVQSRIHFYRRWRDCSACRRNSLAAGTLSYSAASQSIACRRSGSWAAPSASPVRPPHRPEQHRMGSQMVSVQVRAFRTRPAGCRRPAPYPPPRRRPARERRR